MLKMRSRIRRRGPAAVGAVICAVGVAACGGFDSAASGEHLIKDYVKKFGQGKVTVKSAKCPGGVKEKAGTTYSCNVVLHDSTTNANHTGTITIHIASGNKVEITGSQDLHFQ
jgi:hypothetical protein